MELYVQIPIRLIVWLKLRIGVSSSHRYFIQEQPDLAQPEP